MRIIFLLALLALTGCSISSDHFSIPSESRQEAAARKAIVAERKKGVEVICHRGASEFAHENTLEAYRAALELGADGNEIDVRMTRDGVLVCFHDDMLDRTLEAYGDVSDYAWAELRRLRFREPGKFGKYTRIPELSEVLELHRRMGGLFHLDLKKPGMDQAVADLLTRMDLWDHLIHVDPVLGAAIDRDPRFARRLYRDGLFEDHHDMDEEAIRQSLKKKGYGLIVDDPRVTLAVLGRPIGKPSTRPVRDVVIEPAPRPPLRSMQELAAILDDEAGWDVIPKTEADKKRKAAWIVRRAQAAEEMLRHVKIDQEGWPSLDDSQTDVYGALQGAIFRRSLHPDWTYHGLDGAMALRTALRLWDGCTLVQAEMWIAEDDSALEPLRDPTYAAPRSWVDWRIKMTAMEELGRPAPHLLNGARTDTLRGYLNLDGFEARKMGPRWFDIAAKGLLQLDPRPKTVKQLLNHRLSVVRGRARLYCLAHDLPDFRLPATRP